MQILFKIIIFFWGSSFAYGKTPSWVTSPVDHCPKEYLCAVGEGDSVMLSDSQARNALAKIFSIEIQSTFVSQVQSSDGSLDSDLTDQIKESTDYVLEGSEILKRHEGELHFYSLAGVKKSDVKERIEKKMKALEEAIKDLSQSKELWDIVKADFLISHWDQLYARFSVVSDEKKSLDPSLRKKIISQKKSLTKDTAIYIQFKEDEPSTFKPLLESSLVSLGYSVVEKAERASHFIKGEFVSEKEYFNVNGFVKYRFRVKLYTTDKDGKKRGVIESNVVSIGRSLQQAYNKSIDELKKKVIQSFSELKLN